MGLVLKILKDTYMKKQEEKNSANREKPKRQRRVEGAVMAIHIDGQYYVYMQSLPYSQEVVFDYHTDECLTDLTPLLTARELFRVCVYAHVISDGIWRKIGKLPIRDDLKEPKMKYIYDRYSKEFFLYKPGETNIPMRPATKEQCRGLERTSVWGRHNVEDRIRGYYNNKPCQWIIDEYEIFKD